MSGTARPSKLNLLAYQISTSIGTLYHASEQQHRSNSHRTIEPSTKIISNVYFI